MSALHTLSLPATPEAFWKWGRFVFSATLGLALLVIVYLTWRAPSALASNEPM
jgi:hypothetical protein